jgi:hypothetical protein
LWTNPRRWLPGAKIVVTEADCGVTTTTTTADEQGRYTVTAVQSGSRGMHLYNPTMSLSLLDPQ